MNEALTLGNILQILQIAAILGGGLFFLWQVKAQLMVMHAVQTNFVQRIEELERDIKKLSEVTIDLARQDERMTAIDNRITLLGQMMENRWQRNKGSSS